MTGKDQMQRFNQPTLVRFGTYASRPHLHHRYFGSIIASFQSGQGIPKKVKYRTITILWLSMAFSCWIVAKLWLCVMLIATGLGVSIYLLRLPDYKERRKQAS